MSIRRLPTRDTFSLETALQIDDIKYFLENHTSYK